MQKLMMAGVVASIMLVGWAASAHAISFEMYLVDNDELSSPFVFSGSGNALPAAMTGLPGDGQTIELIARFRSNIGDTVQVTDDFGVYVATYWSQDLAASNNSLSVQMWLADENGSPILYGSDLSSQTSPSYDEAVYRGFFFSGDFANNPLAFSEIHWTLQMPYGSVLTRGGAGIYSLWQSTGNVNIFSLVEGQPTSPVPEPATMLLMGTGLAGLIGARRKKKK